MGKTKAELEAEVRSLKSDLEFMKDSLDQANKRADEARQRNNVWWDGREHALVERLEKAEAERDALQKEHDIQVESYRAAAAEIEKLRKQVQDLEHLADEVEKIQRKHNMLTLESLDNALKQWNYTDGKLSHDLCMPLESLIRLLDEYGVNDFCKLRERLMYGPADEYNSALLSIRKLEKRNVDLEGVANDLEKQRKKAVQSFEKAARKNDELQCEVIRLTQENRLLKNDRLPSTYLALSQPDDEICGRKIKEWMGYHAVLVKYGISSPESLDKKLNPFDFLGKPVKFWRGVSDTLKEYYIDSVEELDNWLHPVWYNNMVCGKIVDTMKKHHVENADDLDRRLTLQEKYQEAAYDIQKSKGFKWLSDYIYGGAND